MARETFSDPAIAQTLNAAFLPILIDREERPDLDRIYTTYLQAVNGRAGWPLSVWLTPELTPFFGGTYFPPEERNQRPGFRSLLDSIAEGWTSDRTRILAEGERIRAQLVTSRQTAPIGDGIPDLTEPAGDAFERAYTYFFENHDAQWGGFGGAPKFPRPQIIEFLLRCAAIQGVESEAGVAALEIVRRSLAGMSRGGIHDQVGGGFHRCALDDEWRVPQFEKTLYDQALIVSNLVEAYNFTGDDRLAGVALHLLSYVGRELRHSAGGFCSGEGADGSAPDSTHSTREGGSYLWDFDQLESLCGEDFAWFAELFGLSPEGNVPRAFDPRQEMGGLNVLHQVQSVADLAPARRLDPQDMASRLAGLLERLRLHRTEQPRPLLDDKVITGWNGLMIAGLARASVCPAELFSQSRDAYREMAEGAASFVRNNLWDRSSRTLKRVWCEGRVTGPGLAEDYAAMIHGLIELYDATYKVEWLEWADQLQTTMDALFWDTSGGGYFQTPRADPSIILHLKDDHDGAEPSANSLAASNLLRLAALLQDDARHARGMHTLQAFRETWSRSPWTLPAMLGAMEWALSNRKRVLILGHPSDPEFHRMVEVARDRRGGRWVTVAVDPRSPDEGWVRRWPEIAEIPPRTEARISTSSGPGAVLNGATDLRLALNS